MVLNKCSPLTHQSGTFIEYRTGMVNISPIGRNARYAERVMSEDAN